MNKVLKNYNFDRILNKFIQIEYSGKNLFNEYTIIVRHIKLIMLLRNDTIINKYSSVTRYRYAKKRNTTV